MGRSRRQNTFRVPEASEQRARVSQPQPRGPGLSCFPLLWLQPAEAHLSTIAVLSQLPRSLLGSGLWEKASPTKTQKAG